MTIQFDWEYMGAAPEGQPFKINGLDVWQHDWKDAGQRVNVKDPLYHQDFTFEVWQVAAAEKVVTFAAGEFSNGMWGFYARRGLHRPELRYYHYLGLVFAAVLVGVSVAFEGHPWARFLYFGSLVICGWFGAAWKAQRKRRREQPQLENQEDKPGGWGFPMK